MANVLLPAHLSCYSHPFTLSLSEFLKILSFFLFFFPLGKVNNWKYNLSDKPYGSFQRWVSVLSEMDFGHAFSVLAPHFPYKKFHNLQNSSSRCWSTTDSSVVAFRALESFLTASFSSSPVLTSPSQMGTLCLHRARQSGTKSFLPCSWSLLSNPANGNDALK